MSDNGTIVFSSCISLEGNPISLTYIPNQQSVLYSMDTVYVPFSTMTEEVINPGQRKRPAVGSVLLTDDGWKKDAEWSMSMIENMEGCLDNTSANSRNPTAKGKSMRELLYNVEVLRKKDSDD